MTASSTSPRPWVADVVAGVTVALVLVPQSMAYAELAGMPPQTGLFAAALPPIFAAAFASSPWLQTGPTAMTSLLAFGALSSLATPASPEYVGLAAILALIIGLVRISVGALRAGVISYLMSQAVLRGFTLGAALLIFASQIPSALGAPKLGESVMVRALHTLSHPGEWSWGALGFTALTLVLIQGGRKLTPLFPGVLVAMVGGVVGSAMLGYAASGGDTVGAVAAGLPHVTLDLPWARVPELLVPGVVIALVGFAEVSSISQALAESEHRSWDPDREFISQGVANVVAGLFGSFPVGGSFSRSALSHLAGARSRLAGGITGLAALLVLPVTAWLSPLPRAVLGAVVLASVLKLLTVRPMQELWKLSKPQFALGAITFLATLLLSPHIELAVVLGVALSVGLHLLRELRVEVEAERSGDGLILRPLGVVWFGSAPAFRRRLLQLLDEHAPTTHLELDLSGLGRVDLTGALQLEAVVANARGRGLAVQLTKVPPQLRRVLGRALPEQFAAADAGPVNPTD